MYPRPRPEVIEQLSKDALSAIEDAGIVELTAAEVLSTCFTITKRVTQVMIQEVTDPAERAFNIEIITQAIADLYSVVPKGRIH